MSVIRRASTSAAAVLGTAVLTAGLAAPAVAAASDQDATWLNAAHRSNLAEIAAGTSAQDRATTETVRDLGAEWVEDHTALDEDLTALAEELDVELDAEPTAEQQAHLADVEENEGQAYDTAWIAQQTAGHRSAVAAGQTELAEGSDDQVVALAQAAAPVIENHYDELLAAADEYGVPVGVPAGSGGQVAGATSPGGVLVAGLGGLVLLGSAGALVRSRRRA